MAEPAGPFHLLRAGPGRFLCYCRPGPGPGGSVYVTDALEVWAGELGARPLLGCRWRHWRLPAALRRALPAASSPSCQTPAPGKTGVLAQLCWPRGRSRASLSLTLASKARRHRLEWISRTPDLCCPTPDASPAGALSAASVPGGGGATAPWACEAPCAQGGGRGKQHPEGRSQRLAGPSGRQILSRRSGRAFGGAQMGQG
ncbi:protein PAXX isoform 3-T3 [Theristicus caerulescens]